MACFEYNVCLFRIHIAVLCSLCALTFTGLGVWLSSSGTVVYITWRSALMFPYIVSLYAQEHLLNECTVLILLIYSGTKNSSMHHLCSNAILMKL